MELLQALVAVLLMTPVMIGFITALLVWFTDDYTSAEFFSDCKRVSIKPANARNWVYTLMPIVWIMVSIGATVHIALAFIPVKAIFCKDTC